MIRLTLISVLVGFAACQATRNIEIRESGAARIDEPVAVEVFHSLRIPAQRVKIALDAHRNMNIEIQDQNEETRHSRRAISEKEMSRVQSLVRRIDWIAVEQDDIHGLDGTVVRSTYRGVTYSVWTPTHNTFRRKLTSYVELKNVLFRLGGFDEHGMPE